MEKLQLLRHSYSSKLQAYWNNLSVKRQRVLLLTTFTLYGLVGLFIVKTSFSSKLTSDSQEKQNNIRPVKYLLEKQKAKSQLTSKTNNYESQSIR
ncbi:hypothetical protein HX069_16725 [Myroides odoratimimus]|uniref:hypothetical protein n=1 Tax=Myroides odoratimimus TaxID=76832 RepID=UPI00257590E9|nr:hypothetical protein [Myroides odoratimimus]MDM1680773.1 hypothetical protein [Myroides odoratimimus]